MKNPIRLGKFHYLIKAKYFDKLIVIKIIRKLKIVLNDIKIYILDFLQP